jgi:competence protein ComEC
VLTSRYRPITWLIASVVASLAVEIVLLPVAAWTFLRVTIAGLVLNLIAVPLMGVVQIAGMVVSAFDSLESIARPAGWVAHIAASSLVSSARLVDVAPWLSARVPPPPVALVVVYYAALGATFAAWRPVRAAGLSILAVSMLFIAAGLPVRGRLAPEPEPRLRLTVFDVGQGDASLLQLPDRSSLLVDAGGIPFGRGGFDIGARVLAPALWARGLRSLETLLVTHGDPDHIGGARSVVGDFEPTRLWEGVPVSRHAALQDLLLYARERGARAGQLHRGDELHQGGVRLRVLHPPAPDWERQRVRNDDSVMIEVMYGDVAMLLTGDVSAASERTLAPLLAPARVRLLKVAHHGSRTSTSRELLEHWRPHIAIISCGRGNTFGHPAPDVIERLQSVGATILRTDLHGQVTVDTDGSRVEVTTYLGGIDMNMVMTRS